jgi:hypothetical protein
MIRAIANGHDVKAMVFVKPTRPHARLKRVEPNGCAEFGFGALE